MAQFTGTPHQDITRPATKAAAITPHDSNELAGGHCRAIYVGGAGNVVVIMAGDSASVTFTGVPAGTILPICARIVTTSSTATSMVALY
jgi:hypothetical protein